MRVFFKKVRWKNFMGTGNAFIELDLGSDNKSLIVGLNGSGKSQFIEAIVHTLYNRPYRNVNKPDLINSINEKECVTEIEFDVMGVPYKVIRGMKPAIFEVWKAGEKLQNTNMQDLQTNLEKNILKMNYKTFIQVVILGTANFVPFMELPAAGRREVNESLLDLQSFSVMNTLMKGKISVLKQEITETQLELARYEQQKKFVENQITKLSEVNADEISLLMEKIVACDHQIAILNYEKEDLLKQHVEMEKNFPNVKTLEANKTNFLNIKGVIAGKKHIDQENKKFFEKNEKCPTCFQSIETHHKESMLANCVSRLEKAQEAEGLLNKRLSETIEALNKASRYIEDLNKLRGQIGKKDTDAALQARVKLEIQENIKRLQAPTTALEGAKNDLIGTLSFLDKSKKELGKKQNILAHYNVILDLLKDDGIKASIINKYIPIINTQVNAYLSTMNFFVGFKMDELFEVTFLSRHRDKFKYAMFSQGQKARIDLALMMTWRDVAKLKNSISTNLLIMDEVFDGSLDGPGSDELFNILKTLKDQNVWVVSHKDLYVEKFDKVYKFVLERNFSNMTQVNGEANGP